MQLTNGLSWLFSNLHEGPGFRVIAPRRKSFFESEWTQKHTPLSMDYRTLAKAMFTVVKAVENKIAPVLPSVFGVVLNGWSHNAEHFVAVYASYALLGKQKLVLLGFASLLDENFVDHSADLHIEFVGFVLAVYNRQWDSIVYIVGDNCSVNKVMASRAKTPLVGYANHRLNLIIKLYLQDDEAIIDMVHRLVLKLKYCYSESQKLRYR